MSEKFISNSERPYETPEVRIQNSTSLDALMEVLGQLSAIPTEEGGNEWGLIDATEVVSLIDKVHKGEAAFDSIPTGYGLREQFKNLFLKETLEKVDTVDDLDRAVATLEHALHPKPFVTEEGREILFSELKDLISNCVIHRRGIQTITRSYGLRGAVERALNDKGGSPFLPLGE